MKRSVVFIFLCLLLAVLLAPFAELGLSGPAREAMEFFELMEMDELVGEELAAEQYWRMVDEKGQEIMITGRRIHVGDEYLTEDNRLYRVHRVRGRTAHARFIREVGAMFDEEPQGLFVMLRDRVLAVQADTEEEEEAPAPAPKKLIGIYHTHNAESYVPTDGTDSINGAGGIHNVGDSFTKALEEKGVTVIHDETLHLPHDAGAYRRSRPTAQNILAEGPDVIFDVHRDATPRHVYAAQIEDEWVTKVQIVVGRQNANMRVNRQFALDLKNTADQVHPGLVKGIFMARGNYNQDLTPLSLLLEVGAHTNSREAAESGIALFADVVSFYFYGPEEKEEEQPQAAPSQQKRPPGARTTRANRTALGNIFLILGFTLAVGIGFVLLNTGRLSDLVADLKFALAPFLEKIRYLARRGDRYLDPAREKIYLYSEPLRKLLSPAARAMGMMLERFKGAVIQLAERADRQLASWQAHIHDFAMMIKERITDLYYRLANRSRLR